MITRFEGQDVGGEGAGCMDERDAVTEMGCGWDSARRTGRGDKGEGVRGERIFIHWHLSFTESTRQ